MYLVIAFLVITQSHLHPALDIRGREKHDAAFVLKPVIQVYEVVEHPFRQLVRFIEQQHRVLRLYQRTDDCVKHVSYRHAVSPQTYLLRNVADKVAPLHVFRAQNVVGAAVLTLVKPRRRGLAASGFAHHPGHVLPFLGVSHRIGHLLCCRGLHHLPGTGGGGSHLRGYLAPHVVADVLPLAAQHRAYRSRTRAVQTGCCLVLARIFHHIEAQGLAYLFFLFLVHIVCFY